jgi:hypothetical protein
MITEDNGWMRRVMKREREGVRGGLEVREMYG